MLHGNNIHWSINKVMTFTTGNESVVIGVGGTSPTCLEVKIPSHRDCNALNL